MALSRFGRRTSSRRQVQDFRVLTEPSDIGLIAGQTGAVDARLLPGTDADGHAVFYVADGVGLGVFQGNEGDDEVPLSRFRNGLVLRRNVLQQIGRNLSFVSVLFKGDAVDFFRFDEVRLIVGIDLKDAVIALLFGL